MSQYVAVFNGQTKDKKTKRYVGNCDFMLIKLKD